MANISPFQGVRFNPRSVEIAKVVCPPYDIISPDAQKSFYSQDGHNIIRIELGLDTPDDTEQDNRYTRAGRYLSEWMAQEILVPESKPAIYLYTMDYRHPREGAKILKGFYSRVELEEIGRGRIFPHEWTFPKAKQDRLQLLRAVRANTSPIFSMFSDPDNACIARLEAAAGGRRPDIDIIQDGVRHRVWVITDPEALGAVSERLRDQPLFIADGHHRYETALNFQKEMRANSPSRTPMPWDYVFMYCANMDDPGLSLLPIHRVVLNPLPVAAAVVLERLARRFELLPVAAAASPTATRDTLLDRMHVEANRTVFGVVVGRGPDFYLARLRSEEKPASARVVDQLDVTHFQRLVLEEAFGMQDSAAKKENQIQFIKDEDAALRLLAAGDAGIVFFLNPTRIQQVRGVVLAGDRMPQKSTYFFPKPVTGLVLNKL